MISHYFMDGYGGLSWSGMQHAVRFDFRMACWNAVGGGRAQV